MITNNLNLRETKILNGIQIAFNDFREKLESVDFFVKMKSEIFRAVWYIFKKNGSYDIIEFIPGEHKAESFYDTYRNYFYNSV